MTITCGSCGAENPGDARFCLRCGTAVAAACRQCGRELPSGARFCPACATPVREDASQGRTPATTAPREPTGRPQAAGSLTEERKLVTILFADVTGSTSLGERLDAERLRALLQSYFGAMSSVIASWGGTVEKFIGDAVMAVFGVPVLREDDAHRALRAALEMHDRLAELNRDFEQRHRVTLQMRIGVNTGEVIVPVRESADGAAAAVQVAGDAVNVAARLEQMTEPGTVLVGERTHLATRGAFRFAPGVELEVRGRREPVRAYRLLEAAAAAPEAVRGIPGLTPPMVGRDRELKALEAALEQAAETGRPQLVIVYGPAGIGKSRLTIEFLRRARAARPSPATGQPDIRVLRGRCLAAGHGITFWALAEILRDACGIALDDAADTTEDKLESAVRDALSRLGVSDDEVRTTVDALALTAGIAVADSTLAGMEPRDVGEELARAWPRFATALAASGPTILVLEDLHWAGDQLVEMVEHILGRSSGPLLLVATARPEFSERHAGFAAGRDDVTAISLRPLDAGDSERLIDGLLAIAELPDELRTEILGKAEGNPFFLEEIVRRLIDEGVLVAEGDRWRARPGARAAPLPDTVHALLSARIDGLPSAQKRVLQEASVVGRIFWEEPVRRSLGNGGLSPALRELERKALVLARPTSTIAGQAEYGFKHALVRDVAYASLPRTRRARAHASVGDWITELTADRADEFAELVAHHYRAAVIGDDADLAWADDPTGRDAVRQKAFAALLSAGAIARRRYALAKAVELHEQALVLAADDRERAEAWTEVGEDHDAAWHGDEAWQAFQNALAIRREHGDRAAVARLALRLADLARRSGTFRSRPNAQVTEEIIDEGLQTAEDPAARAELLVARAYGAIAWLESGQPDPVDMADRVAAAAEAAGIANQLGLAQLQLHAEAARAHLHWLAREFPLALESVRRQLQLLPRIESASERAELLTDAAELAMMVDGDLDGALDLAKQSLSEANGLTAHERMHATAHAIEATYRLGRWDEAEAFVREHLEAFRDEADRTCASVLAGPEFAALLAAQRGDVARARELLALTGDDAARDAPTSDRDVRTAWVSARVLVALGDAQAGRRLAERYLVARPQTARAQVVLLEALVALGDWAALDAWLPEARALSAGNAEIRPAADRAEGHRRRAAGDARGAEAAFRRALDGYERLGMVFDAALTQEALADVTGDEEARALRESALEVFERLRAAPHADRIRDALEEHTR